MNGYSDRETERERDRETERETVTLEQRLRTGSTGQTDRSNRLVFIAQAAARPTRRATADCTAGPGPARGARVGPSAPELSLSRSQAGGTRARDLPRKEPGPGPAAATPSSPGPGSSPAARRKRPRASARVPGIGRAPAPGSSAPGSLKEPSISFEKALFTLPGAQRSAQRRPRRPQQPGPGPGGVPVATPASARPCGGGGGGGSAASRGAAGGWSR
jgi:hypothetical protein